MAGWADAPGATNRDLEDARAAVDLLLTLMKTDIIVLINDDDGIIVNSHPAVSITEHQGRLLRDLRKLT